MLEKIMINQNKKTTCLCFDLTNLSRSAQFIILSSVVFAFHISQGYMNELIFKLPGFKPYSMFLTLLQFGIYAVLAFMESLFTKRFDVKRVFSTR